jgi:hypothetical protein
MVVDELRPIVGVDPLQAEGQRLPDLVQGRLDAVFAAPQDRPGLPPGRVDVGDVERMRELAVGPIATMGDKVELGEPGEGHVPVIRLQGNVVLEQGPGLGAPVAPRLKGPFDRRQAPIDLARADGPQLSADRGRQAQPAAGAGQPQREQGLEPYGPGIARGVPDGGQRLDHRPAVRGRPAAPPGSRPPGGRAVEEPERRLPMVAGGRTELIEDLSLGLPGRLTVAPVDGLQVLLLRAEAHHVNPPPAQGPPRVTSQMARASPLGNILDGAIRRP